MRKIIAVLFMFCSTMGMALADELIINQDVPDRYVVVKGDTLWDIASRFLRDPWKWQEIWYNNPQVENPHLIYPGDVIALITVGGEQRFTVVQRGDSANTIKINPEQANENGVVKLRPQARSTPIFGAIPAIPREHVEGFLSGNRILPDEQMNSAPYIISGSDGRLLLGAGDRIYGRGEFSPDLSVYQVYRIGDRYRDPNTKEVLGYEAIEVGSGRLNSLDGDIATFDVLRSNQQIAIGDRILPSDQALLESVFYPSEPPQGLNGEIIDVARGVQNIGQFDIVLLNVGEREGVEPGNIFRVDHVGDRIRDPVTDERIQLPSEEGGMLMVFRTFRKMSYGLILSAKLPMQTGDRITDPGF
ncbi:MAG: LysM domain-containing protein [Reinekea sp.]